MIGEVISFANFSQASQIYVNAASTAALPAAPGLTTPCNNKPVVMPYTDSHVSDQPPPNRISIANNPFYTQYFSPGLSEFRFKYLYSENGGGGAGIKSTL
jgi:hypothetical protein